MVRSNKAKKNEIDEPSEKEFWKKLTRCGRTWMRERLGLERE